MSEKPKRERQKITDKQKAARLLNLQKGREARKQKLEERKANKEVEYDIDSNSESETEDDEVDIDSFVLSKKKPAKKESKRKEKDEPDGELKKEMQELRGMMYQMVKQQKKARKPRKEGGTKIVLLPNQQPTKEKQSAEYNAVLSQFMQAINRK